MSATRKRDIQALCLEGLETWGQGSIAATFDIQQPYESDTTQLQLDYSYRYVYTYSQNYGYSSSYK